MAKPSRPRELYRDPARGKIAGVCAGIGRYFDWPVWPIRLALVVLAVTTQVFPLIAVYLIAWFVLDPLSSYSPPGLRGQVDGWVRHTRSHWDGGPVTQADTESMAENGVDVPKPGVPEAKTSQPVEPDWFGVETAFAELESRVQALERHVTEPAFVLRQQFRSL
ncbi:MAG TPA: PspC domain-containing protein [Permianibacter sp.]|nr:PspC domain-containing protein [Permianibacter sp.]